MATITAREQGAPQALTSASWRALVAAFLGWMFDGYETYALILVAAVALRQLLAPDQLASLPIYIGGLLAVTLIGWATGGIIAGILADYIGRKRMLMLSILWYALFTGLTAFAGSYPSLLILRFLTGLGLGAEWGPGTAILGESWPAKSRGRAASVLQSAIGFGLLIASGVWLFVAPLGPAAWRYMFLIGVLPALSVLWIRTSVQDPDLWIAARERRRQARERVASGRSVRPEDRALARFTVKQILASPDLRRRLLLLLMLSLSTIVAWWAVSTWIPFYAGQIAARAGGNAQRAGALAGLYYNVGGILGYFVFGVLADAWGRKPTMVLYYAGAVVGRARLGDLPGLRRHPLPRGGGTAPGRLADREPGRRERGGVHHRARLCHRPRRDAVRSAGDEGPSPARLTPARQLGIQAVTVISTSSSGEFSAADTVVRAGLLVGKYFAYSSL